MGASKRLLLLAVAAVALAALPAALGQKKLDVKTTVTEQLFMRHKFPKITIDKALINLIPVEAGIDPKSPKQLKNKYALLYRGTMSFSSIKGVCAGLKAKNAVTITATKKTLKETVAVIGASAPCTANTVGNGKAPAFTFITMLKKSGVPLKNTYTIMYCEKGKTDCYIYRLYKPCLKGRCKLEPDPTLASSVFSSTADVVSKAGSCDETIGRYTDAINQCKKDDKCKEIMEKWEGYIGIQYDTPEALKAGLNNFRASLQRVVDACKKGVTHSVGTTEFSDLSKDQFAKEVLSDLSVGPGTAFNASNPTGKLPNPSEKKNESQELPPSVDNTTTTDPKPDKPNTDPNPGGNDTSPVTPGGGDVSNLPPGLASVAGKVDWAAAGKTTGTRDQGFCSSGWAMAALGAIESKLLIDNPSLKPADVKLSVQQLLDCSDAGGCGKGNQNAAADFTLYVGLHLEANYEYVSDDTGVPNDGCLSEVLGRKKRVRVVSRRSITDIPALPTATERQAVLKTLVTTQPAMVFLAGNILQDYQGGVVDPSLCKIATANDANLAALLIGYDDDAKVWIFQNYMGKQFGDSGTFRIAMTEKDSDKLGPCGIYSAVFQPTEVTMGEEDPIKLTISN